MSKPLINFQLFTIFPEMFPGCLKYSLAGKALRRGIWRYETVNIWDYGIGKHKIIDSPPIGGGGGMVMRPDVLGRAIEENYIKDSLLIYMSPRGSLLTEKKVYSLCNYSNISIICGRFNGIDKRVVDEYHVEEISIGDYVISGAEPAALVLMDACIRILPDVIGNMKVFEQESFGNNSEYSDILGPPLYASPRLWKNREVPSVLLSGNHNDIMSWRKERAEEITKGKRNDLWEAYESSKKKL